MSIFNVYHQYPVNLVKARGCYLWDDQNTKYLDMYGGHGVISIGHGERHYVNALKDQLDSIGFYSNAVQNKLQGDLAEKLKVTSGCDTYNLFLCNSGAEANENAMKLASFETGRTRIVAFENGFHGRTSAAVAVTDNEAIKAPLNKQHEVTVLPLNNIELLRHEIGKEDVAAVIVEGIQGVGGLDRPKNKFLRKAHKVCKKYGTLLILDEIQSGFGRSGKFFAFQYSDIEPDLITMAKGMGNGFPVAGVLISDRIKAVKGRLGTTFGGGHLACSAAIAVLDGIREMDLKKNALEMNTYLLGKLEQLAQVRNVKGRGLMLGIEFDEDAASLRKRLVLDGNTFTGSSNNPKQIRLLPPLSIGKVQIDEFVQSLIIALEKQPLS
jgi:acetylornithine aminotransferase